MGERYVTLKLTLSKLSAGRYRSRIEQSPRGASKGSGCDFDLSPEQIQTWAAQAPRGRVPAPADLAAVGQQLYSKILQDKVLGKFEQCRAVAEARQAWLRLGLAVLPNELVAVPWEYLHDGDSFLLKGPRLIVRVIDELPEQRAYFRPIQHLLVAIANPTKDPDGQFTPFDADGHRRQLEAILKPMAPTVLPAADKKSLAIALRDKTLDGLYFVGHGRFDESLEGQLVLEAPDSTPDYLDADKLAQMVQPSSVRFVYLNSCSTAASGLTNAFSGVAQRLMLDGKVEAVVAMQTPVNQTAGLTIATGFFDELSRGSSPELALARSRTDPDDFHTWGVPVVYTYLGGADDFERNQLASLLRAEGTTRFELALPTFQMGVPKKAYVEGKVQVTVEPSGAYHYKNETHPLTAVMAAWDVMGLLTKVVPSDQIEIVSAGADTSGAATHQFVFGGKQVTAFLASYGAEFRFDQTGPEWVLEDTKFNRKYTVPDLSQLERTGQDFDDLPDYGVVVKIRDQAGNRVFFAIAGLGDRATRGSARYLVNHWPDILREHADGGFAILLTLPAGMKQFHQMRLVDRKTGRPVE